jgi:hypothetical protein
MVNIETKQKTFVKNSKFVRFVIAGVLATIAFNGAMYLDIAITGVPLDIAALMGELTVGESEYTETVGHVIHFANGIGLSLLFGYVALPISKKIIKLPVIVYAIVFAIVETVIAVWFVMLPMLGAGIAGLNIGLEVSVMTLVRHVIFGLVLGVVIRK